MSDKKPIIVWFRADLRVADHAALTAAAKRGPVIPVYIFEDHQPHPPGGAGKWFLQEALQDLDKNLRALGAPLILQRGDAAKLLPALAHKTAAAGVFWHRCYEPGLRDRDEALAAILRKQGVEVEIHPGYLLFDPAVIATKSGTPFKVFTPFSRACFKAADPGKPLSPPRALRTVKTASETLASLKLVPKTAVWPKGLRGRWEPSEKAAQRQLRHFVANILDGYKTSRDRPGDADGTSGLSAYLHFGLISPRQAWAAVHKAASRHPAHGSHAERYLLELLWRDFAWYLLVHFPHTIDMPLDARFAKFPWRRDAKGLQAWQRGLTGYPIVDAGIRQLWQTGWMHNRVRMIAASFLVKDLLIDWRLGIAWFWDTLVDADLGNNTLGWQWVAGCGADASPFFRIFNPMLQGQKFDPAGDYVRRYVPELAKLDKKYIHEPWAAPADILTAAGVRLGKTYPFPIVDHKATRDRALLALKTIKKTLKIKASGDAAPKKRRIT